MTVKITKTVKFNLTNEEKEALVEAMDILNEMDEQCGIENLGGRLNFSNGDWLQITEIISALRDIVNSSYTLS